MATSHCWLGQLVKPITSLPQGPPCRIGRLGHSGRTRGDRGRSGRDWGVSPQPELTQNHSRVKGLWMDDVSGCGLHCETQLKSTQLLLLLFEGIRKSRHRVEVPGPSRSLRTTSCHLSFWPVLRTKWDCKRTCLAGDKSRHLGLHVCTCNAVVKARPVNCQGSIAGWPSVGTSCLRLKPTCTHVGQSVVLYRLQYSKVQ